ncbi:MAG: aminotransferase class V-fold PLP-dependent enzyme [Planctomycetia bacterium]|nr:aminotransferase class V-fold PLP-dependent enzyme [Planctomycetia bacterium]
MIYLDNNATTSIAPEVFEAMKPYFTEKYWNPSSMYEPAVDLSKEIQAARKIIGQHLGASSRQEIIFTSCATESNNAAIFGAVRANPERRHLITTKVEHPAVLEVCKELQRQGYEITWLDVDQNGNLDLAQFVHSIQPGKTLLVSIMHANNETGVIFPVERLSRILKETDPQIIFHVDATQSFTKIPIDLKGNFKNIDLLSFSGHKIHAPKGIGVLYIRQGTPIRTFLIGGHQENSRRGGTENVPYIIGLAKAVELAAQTHEEDVLRMEKLRNHLQEELEKRIPYIEINGKKALRMPNTLNVAFHGIEGEAILFATNEKQICISSGSACTSGSLDPSHVLTAMKVPSTALQGNIRFSLSRYTTPEEIDRTIDVFPDIIQRIRKLSPFWDKVNQSPCDHSSFDFS